MTSQNIRISKQNNEKQTKSSPKDLRSGISEVLETTDESKATKKTIKDIQSSISPGAHFQELVDINQTDFLNDAIPRRSSRPKTSRPRQQAKKRSTSIYNDIRETNNNGISKVSGPFKTMQKPTSQPIRRISHLEYDNVKMEVTGFNAKSIQFIMDLKASEITINLDTKTRSHLKETKETVK